MDVHEYIREQELIKAAEQLVVKLVDLIMFKLFRVRSKKKGSNGKEEDAKIVRQTKSCSRSSANNITVKKWKNDQTTMKQNLQGSAESKSLKSLQAFKTNYNSSDGPNTASTANSLKNERRSNLANFTTFKTSETRTRTTKNPRKKIKKFHDKERVARNPRYCQSNQLIAEQQSATISLVCSTVASSRFRFSFSSLSNSWFVFRLPILIKKVLQTFSNSLNNFDAIVA